MSIIKSAHFSKCEKYRYTLLRGWGDFGDRRPVVFIGLNPSTADAEIDDPTIRRCIQFAKNWGYPGMIMINLFAYRSTDPKKLLSVDDPVGPSNDYWIMTAVTDADCVVAAWGATGNTKERSNKVLFFLLTLNIKMKCLGMTKDGFPKHPLYLPYSSKLIPFGGTL